MIMADYPRIASFKTAADFRKHIETLGIKLDVDDSILPASESPLAQSLEWNGRTIGNRWCVLPMEGWDCLPDGAPSELTRRRWMNFATGGAKLLFGCEACAVMQTGKSNTRQFMITEKTLPAIKALREEMMAAHKEKFGTCEDFIVGLQLTHSGRYSHPNDDAKLESVTAYSHPLLDERFHCTEKNVVSDAEIKNIVTAFGKAAQLAQKAGFDFVDVKMAHGYLGHEFLSAFTRPGPYGGSFENRTRFFREVVETIRKAAPGLTIATRLSLFDCLPFEPGPDRVGIPMERGNVRVGNYKYAFGGDGTGLGYDLTEPLKFLEMVHDMGINLVCMLALEVPASVPAWCFFCASHWQVLSVPVANRIADATAEFLGLLPARQYRDCYELRTSPAQRSRPSVEDQHEDNPVWLQSACAALGVAFGYRNSIEREVLSM